MPGKNTFNSLILGFCLFTVAFLISRAQFFACPTVEIHNDSGTYIIWIDGHLERGELPPANYIPIGYPLIIKAITLVKDSVYPIVFVQLLLTFLSFIMLLYTVWRFYDKVIYYTTLLCLIVYLQIPNNLYFDISITSESVYNSSLILLVTAIVTFFNSQSRRSAILLSIALATPVLFRPNGIYTIVILFLLISYLVLTNRKALLPALIFPFLSIYFLVSAYSYIATREPIFIGKRAAIEVTDEIRDSITWFDKTVVLLENYTTQSQMYSRIDEMNTKYFVRNFAHTNEFSCYYGIDSTKVRERKMIFKEFYDTDKMKYLLERERNVKKATWFKFYDLFEMLVIKKIFMNPFWIVVFFASALGSGVLLVTSKPKNDKAALLFIIILVNLGTTAVVIPANHMPLPRYSYPAEFMFLLQLPFLIDLIRQRKYAFK